MSPMTARALVALAAACAWSAACGRAPAPPKPEAARRPPACSLITREEMAQILTAPIGKVMPDDSAAKTSCAYPPGEAGSWAQADVAIEWEYRGGRTFEKQMTDAFGGSAVGRQVAHAVSLGDDAAYSREGVLSIRQGTALITVTVPIRQDSEVKATAIGKKLLERLGGSVAAAGKPAPDNRAEKPADTPSPKPAAVPNETEEALKGLMALFGDDDKPDAKKEVQLRQAGTPVPIPFPPGFEPDGQCPDAGPSADAELAAAAAATIPLAEGLTLASTWTTGNDDYDHECLKQITRIDRFAVTVTSSCPNGKDRKMETATRRLCRADLRDSYMYETAFGREIPETMRGALAWSLSTASFSELIAAGSTQHRYLEMERSRNGLPVRLVEDNQGQIERQGKATSRVIVNDRPIDLPIVEASGRYAIAGHMDTFTLKVLDDARFPIVLDYRHVGSNFSIIYTKVTFPTTGEVEKHLATDKRVDVYGIYFDFASDRLRPESGPVLREIGDALTKNPAWTLTINGHTDNVGGDAFNLELSKRRSLSVRRALSETYHIDPARLTTGGFGASQPKESNATVDGRAKNRRVELVRQ
jgi:outer membrane protein OmpA-like peptidoglycan-associated protein